MIDFYYWPTPNGHKVTLFLEETGLDYRIIPVNIGKGEQFAPAYLKINPNNKMPAIVDHAPADGGEALSVFESGAILMYLAEKTGKLIPTDPRGRLAALEWVFWQVGGLGPMCGQNHHFSVYAPEKIPYAINRYVKETSRLYGVLDHRLEGQAFILGDDYSIADIAAYPWVVPWKTQGQDLEQFPNVKRWLAAIAERPATVRAYAQGEPYVQKQPMSEEAKKVLFGQSAETVREHRAKS